ncbi:sugar kinase [Anopheles sinensis]|uniref:Sugar kinase n=1 Tax=Anopheles sinensis TaxID=74873 RepID=A0A084WNN0_ANOSI|nr:sugar kinase [Anopheles sinensis]
MALRTANKSTGPPRSDVSKSGKVTQSKCGSTLLQRRIAPGAHLGRILMFAPVVGEQTTPESGTVPGKPAQCECSPGDEPG